MIKLPTTIFFVLILFTCLTAAYIQLSQVNHNKASHLATVYINTKTGVTQLKLKTAITPLETQQGLMGKTKSEIGDGLLFIFPDSAIRTFWMKNTITSLDILFLDANFKLINFYENTTPNQTSQTYSSLKPAKYVIELISGTADSLGIDLNTQFILE